MRINSRVGRYLSVAALLLGLTTFSSFAQRSGTATLTVVLTDVLELTVNNQAATLSFHSGDNFRTGVQTAANEQLTVTSNRPWDLKVQTSSDQLTNGQESILARSVHMESSDFGGPGIDLSTIPQVLISGAPAMLGRTLSFEYMTTSDNAAFLKPGGTYSTTLLFTASYH